MSGTMDTLAIYEQFRAALGDEKAKGFAQTLGTMLEDAKNAATKEDIRGLRDSLDASVSRLDFALEKLVKAQTRTEARIDALAEAQIRTEARIDALTEAQIRTEARIDALAEAQIRTEARIDALAEAQTRMEVALRSLTDVVRGLVIRTDRHEGTLLELKFRDRLPSYLGRYLRRSKVMQPADLLDEIEPLLESAEVDDFLRADVLARGTIDGKPSYVVGEVSYTADADDVERAARRAAILRKAGMPAVGLVACEAVHPQTIAYAREQHVRVWADGVLVPERPAGE